MSPFITLPGNNSVHGAIVPIASATRTGDSNNTIFTNIPQTYQDLMIVANLRSAKSAMIENFNIGIYNQNNIYSQTRFYTNGSTMTSDRGTGQYFSYLGYVPAGYAAPYVYGSAIGHILNYTSSYNKTFLVRTSSDAIGSGTIGFAVGLAQYTQPITSLFVATEFTNTYGTVNLYGIRSAGQ